jgi:hypothetical protein
MTNWLLCFTRARAVLVATLLVSCGSARKPITTALREAFVPIPRGGEIFSPFVFAVPPNAMTAWQHRDTRAHPVKTFRDPRPFLNPQAFSPTTAWLQVSTSFPQPRRGRASDSAHAVIEQDLFQEGGSIGSTCGSPQA